MFLCTGIILRKVFLAYNDCYRYEFLAKEYGKISFLSKQSRTKFQGIDLGGIVQVRMSVKNSYNRASSLTLLRPVSYLHLWYQDVFHILEVLRCLSRLIPNDVPCNIIVEGYEKALPFFEKKNNRVYMVLFLLKLIHVLGIAIPVHSPFLLDVSRNSRKVSLLRLFEQSYQQEELTQIQQYNKKAISRYLEGI